MSISIRTIAAFGLIATGAVLGPVAPASADWLGPVRSATPAWTEPGSPDISGSKVVYTDTTNVSSVGDPDDPDEIFDIRVYDLKTKKDRLLTPKHDAYFNAKISGNRVVWTGYVKTGRQHLVLRYYNLATGAHRTLPVWGQEPTISGKRICYERDWRIYVYDLDARREKAVSPRTQRASTCDIAGNTVVWSVRGDSSQIWTQNLISHRSKALDSTTADKSQPVTDGTWVAWSAHSSLDLDDKLIAYNLLSGARRVISDTGSVLGQMDIDKGRLVWPRSAEYLDYTELFLTDLPTGITTQASNSPDSSSGLPAISGNRIVWHDSFGGAGPIVVRTITPPTVQLKAPARVVKGTQPALRGKLAVGKTPAGAATIQVEYTTNGRTWRRGATAVTLADGSYTVAGPAVTRTTWVRVRFAGNADFAPAVSAKLKIRRR